MLSGKLRKGAKMDLFGRKRRAAERAQLQYALMQLTSRASLLELVAISLLERYPQEQREGIMSMVRGLIVRMNEMPIPDYIDGRLAQAYRDEQSRVMQFFYEMVIGSTTSQSK